MGSRLLGEWMTFYRLEPRGELRADFRSALMTAYLFNVQVDEKHRRKVEEFLLHFEPAQAVDDEDHWKRMLAMAEQINAMFGGEDLRPKAGDAGDKETA